MKLEKVYVKDKDNKIIEAKSLTCDCGSANWNIVEINSHVHYLCARCETSYCQGGGTCQAPASPSPR